ncbi:MAG: Spy/CpxP family protein refolding chaperone [Myxococcales bacterium]
MKTWKKLAFLALVVGFAGAAVAAGVHHGRAGFMKDRIAARVNKALDEIQATPQQREVVEQAENDIVNAIQAKSQARRGTHQALLEAFTADNFDTQAVQAFADARAQDVKDLAAVVIPSLQKVHDALTPEQRAKLGELARKHHRDRHGGFGGE